uniref:Ripply transcriptional repressor 2 n=1 Tax=Monopterus albus TaxID=43700 RepID=A0A3Q3PYB9_MONAL|nr:protein ripply2-like [Monopterus albus]
METPAAASGLPSDNVSQQSDMWRPWTGKEETTDVDKDHTMHGGLSDAKHPKAPHFVHPVKLLWPKSRCFDYLYREAELLLRNYPVQATICPYQDSGSEADSDDEEEEVEKEHN